MKGLNDSLDVWFDNYDSDLDWGMSITFGITASAFYYIGPSGGMELLDSVAADPDYFQDELHEMLAQTSGLGELSRSAVLGFIKSLGISTTDSIITANLDSYYPDGVRIAAASLGLRENWTTASAILFDAVALSAFDGIGWDSLETDIEDIIENGDPPDQLYAAIYWDRRQEDDLRITVAQDMMDLTPSTDDIVMTQCVAMKMLERANLSNKLAFISQGLRGGSEVVSRQALLGFIRLADAGGAAALDTVEAVAEEVNNDRLARIAQGYLSPVGPMIRPATPSAYDPEAAYWTLRYMLWGQGGYIRNAFWHVNMEIVRHSIVYGVYEHNSIAGSIVLHGAGIHSCNNLDYSHGVTDGENEWECDIVDHQLNQGQRGYNSLSFSGSWTGDTFSEKEEIQNAIEVFDGWGGDGMHKYHTLLDPVPEIGTRSDRGLLNALENDESVICLYDNQYWDDVANNPNAPISNGNILTISISFLAGPEEIPTEYCLYLWFDGTFSGLSRNVIGFTFMGYNPHIRITFVGMSEVLKNNIDEVILHLTEVDRLLDWSWKVFAISQSPSLNIGERP